MKSIKHYNVLPGFGPTMGYTLLYLSLIVLIPLSALVFKTAAVSSHSFAPRGITRCLAMTAATTALGTKLFGGYGEGAGKDKSAYNQVKKSADAISAYVMSEGLWATTRMLPENHAIMVCLGEGLMPKAGETPEMGANPLLGFGRVYARPEVARQVDRLVRRLLNDPSHSFDDFYERLQDRGITVWGAAVDTLENTSRFAEGKPTGPMAVFHLFDSPLTMSRPYESYMGCLTVPKRVSEAADRASVLLDYRTPRRQVAEAIEAAYPGIRRDHIHVWTLRGKSRVGRLGPGGHVAQQVGLVGFAVDLVCGVGQHLALQQAFGVVAVDGVAAGDLAVDRIVGSSGVALLFHHGGEAVEVALACQRLVEAHRCRVLRLRQLQGAQDAVEVDDAPGPRFASEVPRQGVSGVTDDVPALEHGQLHARPHRAVEDDGVTLHLLGAAHVAEHFDLLLSREVHIVREFRLRIVHNLIAAPGTKTRDLKRVFSHPVALDQCRDLFARNRQLEPTPFYDTAGSVKMVVESGSKEDAAIAGATAAQVYGAHIVAESIEDNPQNFTRFLLLSQPDRASEIKTVSNGKQRKTSIMFRVSNKPGALFRSLAAFALRDIDLNKIESRPIEGRPWEYSFYLDFIGDRGEQHVIRALSNLEELAEKVRVLGSYWRSEH